jgi:probable rRNA maturation factor
MRPWSRMPPSVSLHRLKRVPEAGRLPSGRAFARALERAGAAGGEVSLVLTGAEEVRRLNREFLGEDRETDVIAFHYDAGVDAVGAASAPRERPGSSAAMSIWGDVFVSAETAVRQARERELPVREELARLFLHGCLHLLGYRDATRAESRRMQTLQEALLPEVLGPRGASGRSGERAPDHPPDRAPAARRPRRRPGPARE